MIGGRAPSEYLERLAKSAEVDTGTMGKHVSTHLADADLMAQDDFGEFFTDRAQALLDKISFAMGKAIDHFDPSDGTEPDIMEETDDTDGI